MWNWWKRAGSDLGVYGLLHEKTNIGSFFFSVGKEEEIVGLI